MSNIRVTYSGLISLLISLVSVITGTIFSLIVTRSLSAEDFGTWGLMGGLMVYVVVVEPIIAFWTTRQTARGMNVGKTSLISSGLFSVGGMIIYIPIVILVGQQSDANVSALIFATILIPFMFITRTLTAIGYGSKPESVSYGNLAFEIVKIPAGLVLVYFLDLGIEGAIITTVLAHIGNILVLGIFVKNEIRDKIKIDVLKNWIKMSWIPLYSYIPNVIFNLDVMIFSVLTGTVVGVAYYSASLAITSLVAHSGAITRGLYPKLLSGGKREHLQTNLRLFFYAVFPLVAMSISFSKAGLFVLNPIYEIAVPVVIFLSIRGFFYQFNALFYQALQGIEEVDIESKSRFRNYMKSNLTWLPTLRLIEYSLYVVMLAIMLLIDNKSETIELVIRWSAIVLIVQIPFSIYLYSQVKKNFQLKIGALNIMKYLITSIVSFGTTFYLMEEFLVYNESVFVFIPDLLPFLMFGISSYLGITFLIDSKTRSLFKAIINEFGIKRI